jgi:hypothetical protein
MENTTKTDWLLDRIAYLKGLKTRTEHQKILVVLAEKKDRNTQEEKYLAALIRAEKAGERAAKARAAASNLINEQKKKSKEEERKARNHRLILQGVLIDLAELETRSRGEILGILLAAATIDDPSRWKSWKEKGDAKLAEVDAKEKN